MSVPDMKKQTAEGRTKTVFPDPLSIDGSLEVFQVFSHLVPGAPPSGSASVVGEGHLGAGSAAPAAGSGAPIAPASPSTVVATQYLAYCDAVQHPADMAGVSADGFWTGGVFDDCGQAFSAALLHEDGLARVYAIQGSVAVGPLAHC